MNLIVRPCPAKVNYIICYLVLVLGFMSVISCKKFIVIDPPVSSITTAQTFSDKDNATSAIIALYSTLMFPAPGQNAPYFGNGAITIYPGLSADELRPKVAGLPQNLQFWNNNIQANLGVLSTNIWKQAYSAIYKANACINGLEESKTLTPALAKSFIGEAKFIRAFTNFYLVNLFGDIPLVTTTQWASISLMARSATEDVYQQIIQDLQEAMEVLPEDYLIFNDDRVRANKWAAEALLARVYLYLGDNTKAASHSSSVIDNQGLYNLSADLNSVFLKNSSEAILQLQANTTFAPYTIVEASQLLPLSISVAPNYYLTSYLTNAFEFSDQRKSQWIQTGSFGGMPYTYSYKYKTATGNASNNNPTEYYMVLRLAEQYLIRAEAKAQQNMIDEALFDLNIIRNRAGLSDTTVSTQSDLLDVIFHERQVELFAEWGHRWFDLKRSNRVNAILSPIKGSNWQTTDQLYPIPYSELIVDPNLRQNPGY